jgi:hypothetical protein
MINFYDEINLNETIWIPQKNHKLFNKSLIDNDKNLSTNSILNVEIELKVDKDDVSKNLVKKNHLDEKILLLKSENIKSQSRARIARKDNYKIGEFDSEDGAIISNSSSSNITDLEIIDILNKFIFFMFLIFILSLNFFGLYVLPYYVKQPLSIDD